jgi:hypothetical protein
MIKKMIKMRGIAEEFFSAAEMEYIFPRDDAINETQISAARFFKIWTLKECFIKLKGLTVFDMGQAPSFIKNKASCSPEFTFCVDPFYPITFNLYELSGSGEHYILATAVEGEGELGPEFRWFSQSFLPCRSIAVINAAHNPAETVNPKM